VKTSGAGISFIAFIVVSFGRRKRRLRFVRAGVA